ncbi:MAG TPA: RHS repeat-associated core domain-containing protein [Phycisphaerae bacterium]|nr:RHS repeat-associated core domain-containing protein [Phycisphaerae bacterium]
MMRASDVATPHVHSRRAGTNWNVIALTDLGGSVARASCPCLHRLEADATDGDVDATDKGTVGTTCTGTVSGACRILDLDFDGDYDATLFDALPQGLARHPGRPASGVAFSFAHQGLYLDPELGSYQNRHRQYDPAKRRFVQRDPVASAPRAHPAFADGLAHFCYVMSSPLCARDPSGRVCDRPRSGPGTLPTCARRDEHRGGYWYRVPCCDIPYFNCHGYAFGDPGWINADEGEPYPPPPAGSFSVDCPPDDSSPGEEPCPEGYDLIAQIGTPDPHGHSMVRLCNPDGECKWYQKCGNGAIFGPFDDIKDARDACHYPENPGLRTCSCVPAADESCDWY